jgi:NitT/TauT family transport system substrate-binding protein
VDLRLWIPACTSTPTRLRDDGLPLSGKRMLVRFPARGLARLKPMCQNRDKAIELLMKEFPNLHATDERAAADVMLSYCFDAGTKLSGWHDGPEDLAAGPDRRTGHLGQFSKRTPSSMR